MSRYCSPIALLAVAAIASFVMLASAAEPPRTPSHRGTLTRILPTTRHALRGVHKAVKGMSVIALIALLVSALALWKTHLAGFSLEVINTGRVNLAYIPLTLDKKYPALGLQLLFTNKGAKTGYVNDVAVSLQKEGQQQPILFSSVYEKIGDMPNPTELTPLPRLGPFTSFPIKAGDTVAKLIFFTAADPKSLAFEKATYILTPRTTDTSTQTQWKDWKSVTVDVDETDLQVLNVTSFTPTADGRQAGTWAIRSKPTKQAENLLQALAKRLTGNPTGSTATVYPPAPEIIDQAVRTYLQYPQCKSILFDKIGSGLVVENPSRALQYSLSYQIVDGSPALVLKIAGEDSERIFKTDAPPIPPFVIHISTPTGHYLVQVESYDAKGVTTRTFQDSEIPQTQ